MIGTLLIALAINDRPSSYDWSMMTNVISGLIPFDQETLDIMAQRSGTTSGRCMAKGLGPKKERSVNRRGFTHPHTSAAPSMRLACSPDHAIPENITAQQTPDCPGTVSQHITGQAKREIQDSIGSEPQPLRH